MLPKRVNKFTFCNILERDAVSRFWQSPHPQFGGFKLVPYSTVSSIVNNLDDIKYYTLPKQPQKQPVKSSKKTTEPTPSQETGSSKQPPLSTISAPKPQTTLSDTPQLITH